MPIKPIIVFVGIIWMLSSCGPDVGFEAPQPQGSENIYEFSDQLIGKYKDKDGGLIEIHKKYYGLHRGKTIRLTLDSIQKSGNIKLNIEDTTLYDKNNLYPKMALYYEMEDDTVVYQQEWIERTYLSDSLFLRKFRKDYFMNIKWSEYWVVCLLQQDDNNKLLLLSVRDLKKNETEDPEAKNNPEYFDYYFNITKFKEMEDSDDYSINPTKGQLKKLIAKGFFTDTLFAMERIEDH